MVFIMSENMSQDWACGSVRLIPLEYVLFYQSIFILVFSPFDQIQLEYIEERKEFHRRVKQGDHCVTKIDDIDRNGYCFTDGNGLISKGLAKLVANRLSYLDKFSNKVCSIYWQSISERLFCISSRKFILLLIRFEWPVVKALLSLILHRLWKNSTSKFVHR